ncbi:shikimate kinase AroK [Georgenia halophila]|uniref:Shikimate kinase n=1 Tax=Georgenia halophila TaxID=620889 RepID=A0ABP8L7N0_9MICO
MSGADAAHDRAPVLVLVGPPGAGKSTVGRRAAERLGVGFVDTDELMAEQAGVPIGELIVDLGEEEFRAREAEAVAGVLASGAGAGAGEVVALGSGAVPAATADLERCTAAGTVVVFLDVSLSAGVPRVGLNAPRSVALGSARGQFAAMARERRPGYTAVATHTVDTSERDVDEVVDAVLALLDPGLSSHKA